MKYDTIKELLQYASKAENKTFKEVIEEAKGYDYNIDEISYKKGFFGHVVEECLFDYSPNSRSEPDFPELGVELKVTPIRRNKNGTISAKERLVLNIINYVEELTKTFETSSFSKKNKNLLIMFYLYSESMKKEDFPIVKSHFNNFKDIDGEIIRRDWEIIHKMIEDGRAHELSESLTLYLGACTKGANHLNLVSQPNSNIDAMQRAYCLKQSYMTTIARQVISNENLQRIIDSKTKMPQGFEQLVMKKLTVYYGKTQDNLSKEFSIDSKAKSLNDLLVARMLGVTGKVSRTIEFQKANIVPKSIRLEINNTIREDMSFKNFNPKEIVEHDWIDSELRDYFESTRFLISLFRKNNQGDYVFIKAFFWSLPISVLDGKVKDTWQETKRILINGVIIDNWNGKSRNNLPGKTFNHVCHVRPKEALSMRYPGDSNSFLLPNGEWMTKQCFWLDKKYVRTILDLTV